MPAGFPYKIESHPLSELSGLRQDEEVFAIIRHGKRSKIETEHPFLIELALPPLGEERIEVWRSSESLSSGRYKQVHYKQSENFFFGCLCIDESDFGRLADATILAYELIHDALIEANFPALLRMWNFFPAINAEERNLERYRAFCLGRHQALDDWHFTEDLLPAASAIGSQSDGLVIYFLAAKEPGIQVENPRQISAFHYPEQYGPKSPSFSRATLKDWGECRHLYISGTASIVGHETTHVDDVAAQVDETLTNIRTVITQAHSHYRIGCHDIADLDAMRIFIRHPQDAELIMARVKQAIGDSRCQIIPVQGDICRSDLLLEIEGNYTGI